MRSITLAPQKTAVSTPPFIPQAHQWIQLRDCLSEYSDEQALLLCEEEEGRWVAWVPGYGEAILTREQILMSWEKAL